MKQRSSEGGVSVTFDTSQFRDFLEGVSKGMGKLDYRPVLRRIAVETLASTWQRWDAQIDPSGTPWRDLTPYTWSRKQAAGKTRMLVWTGLLRRSIQVERLTKTSMTIGTNVSYADEQQWGDPDWKIPTGRIFLGWSEEDIQRAENLLVDFVIEQWLQKRSQSLKHS